MVKRTKKRTKSGRKKTIKFKVSHQDFKKLSKMKDKSIQQAIKNKEINTKKGFTLKINKYMEEYFKSTFLQEVYNDELYKLEKQINNSKCINELSIYEQCDTVKKNGLYFKVLKKNTNIYKCVTGFIKIEDEEKYFKKIDKSIPTWFGNKYIVYNLAKTSYYGINCYTAVKDIYLIDLFNENNFEIILKLINNTKLEENLKKYSSYNLSLIKTLVNLFKINKEKRVPWKDFWLYTDYKFTKNDFHYCNVIKNLNFKASVLGKGGFIKSYTIFFDLFKILFKKIEFDGIICSQIQSYLYDNGLYFEEIILNSNTINNKLKRNIKHPLDWYNWKFINIKKPNKSIDLRNIVMLNTTTKTPENNKFALMKFINNNNNIFPIIKGNNYIFSYNIHFFNNINKLIEIKDNYNNIIKLIKKYNKNINNLIFQEVRFDDINKKMVFDTLNKLGFNTIKYTENGTKNNKMNILLASKNKLDIKIVNHKDSKNTYRNSILFTDSDFTDIDFTDSDFTDGDFTDSNFTGCAVHLTIGDRYYVDVPEFKDDNLKIKKHNYKERTNQLRGIIKHKPDFIIGDFNFTPEDEETDFLLKNGYNMVTPKTGNTTPYNRVDMCFLHKDSIVKFKNYKNIQCNHSDHLPFMLQIE
jgi:hypothetical protein